MFKVWGGENLWPILGVTNLKVYWGQIWDWFLNVIDFEECLNEQIYANFEHNIFLDFLKKNWKRFLVGQVWQTFWE
jgi:hypothetical protein